MKLTVCQQTLQDNHMLIKDTLRFLSDDFRFLRAKYPKFDQWFFRKVVPGLHHGERTLILERRDASLVGILILKHTTSEKKLCTLRVKPAFENRGLGVRLFEDAFEVLNTQRPLLSVSENIYPKFSRLFDYFGFSQEAAYRSIYVPNLQELSFNGLLMTSRSSEDEARRPCAPNTMNSPLATV